MACNSHFGWISDIQGGESKSYSYRGQPAWPLGHSEVVDKDHYDCEYQGSIRYIHDVGSPPSFSCLSTGGNCCDVDNSMSTGLAITLPVLLVVSLAVTIGLTKFRSLPDNGPVEGRRDALCTAIRTDVIAKFEDLPADGKPVNNEVIRELKEKTDNFEKGLDCIDDLHRIRELLSNIISGMEQTQRPLSQINVNTIQHESDLRSFANYQSIS